MGLDGYTSAQQCPNYTRPRIRKELPPCHCEEKPVLTFVSVRFIVYLRAETEALYR